MKRTRMVMIAILILTLVLVAGCVNENVPEPELEPEPEPENATIEKGYVLDQVDPQIIVIEIKRKYGIAAETAKKQGKEPAFYLVMALKEIGETHTIQSCVFVLSSRNFNYIVIVTPKETSVP